MSLPPLDVQLSDGEKLEVLKRFRRVYGEELEEVESKMRALMTAAREYEFVKQYLGEQPEVKTLLENQAQLESLEKRRQHIGMLVERLDQVIPKGRNQAEAPQFRRY